MLAERLKPGDVIALVSPSHAAHEEDYAPIIAGIERQGYKVKPGRNLYRDTYGYIASDEERARDFNDAVNDPEVRLIFFGGGEGSLDLLPLIDFDAVARNPKLYLSYSDGTSILDAIYARTGLITYYGQTPGDFAALKPYARAHFQSRIVSSGAQTFLSGSPWITLNAGVCEGTLIGGYLLNFALLQRTPYLPLDENRRYLLFLEDHRKFNDVPMISMLLSHIEQSPLMANVAGLLFGCYDDAGPEELLLERLRRLSHKHRIPAAYCADFGHGENHAILPVGGLARMDAGAKTLFF